MLTIKRLLPEIIGILLGCVLAFFLAWLCGTPLPWSGSITHHSIGGNL